MKEPVSDEIKRLQGCINDLTSVLALAAVWSGREPTQIVSTLLDALLVILHLDFAYARVKDPISGGVTEIGRFAQSAKLAADPREIGELLETWLGNDSHNWPSCTRNFIGNQELTIVPVRLGLRDEIGMVVTGSQRSDYPAETERLLLTVAANQAVVAIQEAREITAQKRIAHELEQKVAQRTSELATLVDSLPAMVAVMTAEGEVEFINRRAHKYFGTTVEDLKDWAVSDAIHPHDRTNAVATWGRSIDTGQFYEFDHRLRRSDGAYRWFRAAGLPLRGSDGSVIRWYVLLADIHERKISEQKLREDEAELRQITDAIPVIVNVLGADGTVLHVNQAAFDYFGLAWENVPVADYVARFTHPEDVEKQDWAKAIARGLPFEHELRAIGKDGKYRWFLVRCNPLLDDDGHIIRWYATGTNIEDRKREEERTRNENLALREEITRSSMFEEIVGSSKPLHKVLTQVEKVAPTNSTVLISGETGTGKELIARAIHKRSNRSGRPFISVNCGAIPQSLIASELFGHEKGAFTGAMQRRAGRFEAADGGTLLLDEVGELPMETQVALLRVLQEREFERIGGSEPLKVNVRLLAATNRDLNKAVAAGTFRQDLFYRLNVFPIEVPPLRDRVDDVPVLVEYLIDRYGKKAGKKFSDVANRTLELFQKYHWPGNIRELQNVVERAVVVCDGPSFSIDETWLRTEPIPSSAGVPAVSGAAGGEKEVIEKALAESRGRVSGAYGAAAKLGIPRQTLESKILKLGINKHRFRI
jgi:formate hydrogenlyase transcriptional activator